MAMTFNFGVQVTSDLGSPDVTQKSSSTTSIPWAVRGNSFGLEDLVARYGWIIAFVLLGAGAWVYFWKFAKRKP
jgi:hypothetical protein